MREVRFVEAKQPRMERVIELLESSSQENQWANGGPVERAFAEALAEFLALPAGYEVLPCANGGLALHALCQAIEITEQESIHWGVSAFTFRNQARGYFSGSTVLDCDANARIDLGECERHPDVSGIVGTNVFGVHGPLSDIRDESLRLGFPFVLDNAAGLCRGGTAQGVASYSFHYTKPFGTGEGGAVVADSATIETVRQLINYSELSASPHAWVGNGKISDIACAFHLDRLERYNEWAPLYAVQAGRVTELARRVGLEPLTPSLPTDSVHMSLPFLAPEALPENAVIANPLPLGKYYQPLAPLPQAVSIYDRLVNVPTHPDIAAISDTELLVGLTKLLPPSRIY